MHLVSLRAERTRSSAFFLRSDLKNEDDDDAFSKSRARELERKKSARHRHRRRHRASCRPVSSPIRVSGGPLPCSRAASFFFFFVFSSLFSVSLLLFLFFFCRLSRLESFVFLSRLQVVLSRLKESFIIKKFFSLSFFDMMIFRQKKNKRILVIKTPKPTTTLTLTSYTLFGKEFKREHTTQALTTQTTQTTTQTTTDKGGGGAGEKRENVQGETRRRRRLRRQRGCNHHREKLTTARRRRTARGIPPRTQKSRWTKTKTKR